MAGPGRPKGALNKHKPCKAALERLLDAETGTRPELMDEIVLAVAEKAAAGDIQAASLIFERRDGKVPQAIGGTDELPAIRQVVTGVKRKADVPTLSDAAVQNDADRVH